MGQQQLLLLTLTLVIVGLATVTGIDAFYENRRKAEADTLVFNLVRLAGVAQAWKIQPAILGGGASAEGFAGITQGFDRLGWPTTQWQVTAAGGDGRTTRENVRCYRPNDRSLYCPVPQFSGAEGSLVIYGLSSVLDPTGDSFSDDEMQVVAFTTVSGTTPDDVVTEVLF